MTTLPVLLLLAPDGVQSFQAGAARDPILMRSPEPLVCVTAHVAFSHSHQEEGVLFNRDALQAQRAKF